MERLNMKYLCQSDYFSWQFEFTNMKRISPLKGSRSELGTLREAVRAVGPSCEFHLGGSRDLRLGEKRVGSSSQYQDGSRQLSEGQIKWSPVADGTQVVSLPVPFSVTQLSCCGSCPLSFTNKDPVGFSLSILTITFLH